MPEEYKPWLDSAGWGFYGVTFLILVGPGIYIAYSLKYNDTSAMVWIGLGIFGAAIVGVFITTIANTIIQARIERIREAQRQAERKAEKKKKR